MKWSRPCDGWRARAWPTIGSPTRPATTPFTTYSRLRDIEPGNEEGRRGIIEIANRFALLAERELASQRYQEARGYVGMGLQIDPANASLLALKPLADHPPRGLFARLADLFSLR